MAGFAERAELVARLSLKDDFSGKVGAASAKLRGMEGSLGRIAGHANKGLRNAAANLGKIGVVAGGFVALNVRSGIQSLAELEDATTSVDGAIQELGLTGKLTSQQVATWANQIETNVQAAFDDKEIVAATTNLLRFGKVTVENLQPAMVVMTDLATKTGDVGSASALLGKALAAPEKAAGKLARVGIILTKEQQDQIAAMVKAGKVGKAQAVILDALAVSTKGAAAAAKGPYNDAMNILKDVTEDAQRALGEAFLPLLGRVADKLSKFVADPKNIEKLKGFGRDLAGAFDKVLEVGGQIPWAMIGESLTTAGKGAKVLFDAFTMLPPWVQGAVVTGWGLNKLTGGALGGIVSELGKGLIKGVLGMNAGVVNINAATVNGGGVPGGGGKGGMGLAALGGIGVAAATVVQGVIDVGTIADGFNQGYQAGEAGDIQGVLDAQKAILANTVLLPPGLRELGFLFTGEQQKVIDQQRAASEKITTRVEGMKGAMVQETRRAGDRSTQAAERAKAAVDWSRQAITTGGHADAGRIVAGVAAALRANRTIVNVAFTSTTVRTVSGSTVDWRYRDRKLIPI